MQFAFATTAALATCVAALAPTTAWAADTYQFEVPAQPLRTSLATFTQVTGIEVRLADGVKADVQGQAVRGALAPAAALSEMLGGTGMRFAFIGERLVEVSAAPSSEGARVLAPVRVQGSDASGAATAGPNGSRDTTATEGTKSLTTAMASIAGKSPLPVKETPQTVSVVTRQRIEDQNLSSLADVMKQMPGVTVVQGGGSVNATSFYSRGFEVKDFQIDGGTPLTKGNDQYNSSYVPVFDMAVYDRVEMLRGASGLFNGVGDPGGVISLQRKRPKDAQSLSVEAELGSNQRRRVSVDGSTPVLDEGRLAVRGVYAYEASNFFYDTAHYTRSTAYLNAEAKLTSTTALNVGGSLGRHKDLPWDSGLPRASDGSDLNLPRSICLCTPGSLGIIDQTEYFVQLEQQLGDDWTARLNYTHMRQKYASDRVGFVIAEEGIDKTTGAGLTPFGTRLHDQSTQNGIDMSANGAYTLFGRRHQLTLGGNLARSRGAPTDGSSADGNYEFSDSVPSIYTVDTSAYPRSSATFVPDTTRVLAHSQKQWGAYFRARFELADPVHFTLGWRVSGYQTEQRTHVTDPGGDFDAGLVFKERSKLPPSLGLTWALTPNMTAYASRAGIFQSQAQAITTEGQPLRPVTGTNFETGLKRSDFDGTLNSSIGIYLIKQVNKAQVVFGDPRSGEADPTTGVNCCYVTGGDVEHSRGIDFEVSGALTPRWQMAVSYNWNFRSFRGAAQEATPEDPARPASTSASVTFVPKHIGKLWSTYQLSGGDVWNRLQIGAGLRVVSRKRIETSRIDADGNTTAFTIAQGGYALADLMLRYRVARGFEAQLAVNSLFDRAYYESIGPPNGGNMYGAPRSALLALKWVL